MEGQVKICSVLLTYLHKRTAQGLDSYAIQRRTVINVLKVDIPVYVEFAKTPKWSSNKISVFFVTAG